MSGGTARSRPVGARGNAVVAPEPPGQVGLVGEAGVGRDLGRRGLRRLRRPGPPDPVVPALLRRYPGRLPGGCGPSRRTLVRSRIMEQRVLGRTGRPVSVIGLGTWQLGADWGNVPEADAMEVLRAAVESGVTFFDTADVYGDGRSERVIGRFLADNAGQGIMVATKMGRRVEQRPELYTLENFRAWTDRSRVNLGTDRLDLVQLHCPPTPVYDRDEVYDALDTLVSEQRIA